MARFKKVINCTTGESEEVPFTPEEEAAADLRESEYEQKRIAGLDGEVKKAIRAEGMRRLSEFMEDADFEIAASIHLLFVRTERQWTAGEQPVVDDLKIKFTYVRDLYVAVKQAIANITNMTLQEKENFNAANDVAWPIPPA